MKPLLTLLALASASLCTRYFSLRAYAPSYPQIHEKIINARNKAFVLGVGRPSSFCELEDARQCPDGVLTLVNDEMTSLAASVPGGQFIYIKPDGLVSYSSAHSAARPQGSEIGGFFKFEVLSDCLPPATVLSWQSSGNGTVGLWACPTAVKLPLRERAVLRASAGSFVADGCLRLDGVRILYEGEEFGAWAYS